jgi:uncharacterized membrane protein
MSQAEINDAEWSNPNNWYGGWLGLYVSPCDTRVWVPKRIPALGWTINMGHRRGRLWAAAILIVPVVILAVAAGIARSHRG